VDRCALFVDASYVLADGAMAVHGTRRGESVSWDYEGLVQLLSGLARERTGLPLLRCYWYEATVDGRRTPEQDAIADIPGIKLRVAKIRPGRREGVETEIHRDLTTLARNNAISDALVLSAEEDLAQVIADVQDLGMRVTLVHLTVDGNWTISRGLRQESDDIIEIGGEQLRPYVELIVGAEPAPPEEAEDADRPDRVVARLLANGHAANGGSYPPMPAASAGHSPPAIYTAPVVAEYQRPAAPLPRPAALRDDRARDDRVPQGVNGDASASRPESYAAPGPSGPSAPPPSPVSPVPSVSAVPPVSPVSPAPVRGRPEPGGRQEPSRLEPSRLEPSRLEPSRQDLGRQEPSRQDLGRPDPGRPRVPEEVAAYAAPSPGPDSLAGPSGPEAPAPGGQLRRLPNRSGSQPMAPMAPVGPGGPMPQAPQRGQHAGQGSVRSAPFSGPQPVATSPPPGYQPSGGGVSLADAVQAAHDEGQEFGTSVARDAPALWLEAVLARKPRMPSDLEARLLQGSALPIDFLLHDEVRHALRRGFWDSLERTRR
jgi:hypothetical protein